MRLEKQWGLDKVSLLQHAKLWPHWPYQNGNGRTAELRAMDSLRF